MNNLHTKLVFAACLLATSACYAAPIPIAPTTQRVLLDGHCGNDEWEKATHIALPAGAAILLMHDDEYFYLCATGKGSDYTVLDLLVRHEGTGKLHSFHMSAQMNESILEEGEWVKRPAWELKDYAGFYVPYNGLADKENRKDPTFARGTHRQLQIARAKFAGHTWQMMIGVSAVQDEAGNNAEIFHPDNAVKEDTKTWGRFQFSQ